MSFSSSSCSAATKAPAYIPAEIRLAPKSTNTSIQDQRQRVARELHRQVKQRFGDAPEEIIDLAFNIANREVMFSTYSSRIMALSPDVINKGYGQPFANSHPEYTHTLLREAILSGNTGAAALLLDRGADVHYNDDEMAFQAINIVDDTLKYPLWFPDYSIGSKFLRMWLDRGGDPNTTHPLYGSNIGSLLNHTPKNNLEATLALLDAGADPWRPFAVESENGDYLYEIPGYFISLATSNRQHLEISFRIALEGYYKNGPEDQVDVLLQAFERNARDYRRNGTSNANNTRWAMHMAYKIIYSEMGKTPGRMPRRS